MAYGYCVQYKESGWISCDRGFPSREIAEMIADRDIAYYMKQQARKGFACAENRFDIEIFVDVEPPQINLCI